MFAVRTLRSGRVAVIVPRFGRDGASWLIALLGALWLAGFAALALVPARESVRARVSDVASGSVAEAVKLGDVDAVRALLRVGADVNAPLPDGSTALHWATYQDDVAAVAMILDAGAGLEARTRDGATALSLAAINANPEILTRLLEAGADVDARLRHGETALMLAARTGRAEAIETLVAHGADVDAREDLRGTTALMWAAANRNPEAVAALLAAGADVSATSANTSLGRRPYLADTARDRIADFHRGVGQAGRAIAVSLEQDGETLDVSNLAAPEEVAAIRAADAAAGEADKVAFIDQSDRGGGLTPLVFAVREGDLASAQLLVEAGADVDQTTHYGWTPLLTAVQNRFYRIAAYLLEQGADPNIANDGGWTPLYIATDNRNIEGGDYPTRRPDMDHLVLIEMLLAAGADPNLQMSSSTETRTIFTHQWLHEDGATPFLRAAQSGDVTLMRLLLAHGADPHIATDHGVTSLMVASGIGWVEGVTYEWSPEQTYEAVDLLLDLGADVNAQDTMDLRTALMGAAHKGRTDVVRLLVAHGADMSARDIGSRDSIHGLYGTTWQAIDYADGLVRVGVQSAIAHPETAGVLRELMTEAGLPTPPEGRTLDSICVTDLCR